MGWLDSFLHPERGYEEGQKELERYFQQAQGYLNPIRQHGEEAYRPTFEAMQRLLNPQALQNEWIQGYEESPAAKQARAMAEQHGLNAASSMGLLGSRPALEALQGGSSNISLADRQQYLNDLMQKYQLGTGIGQNIYGAGANAASNASQNAMNQGQNAAQMAYGKENAPGNLFGNLLGTGAGLLGSYFMGKSPWSTVGGRYFLPSHTWRSRLAR